MLQRLHASDSVKAGESTSDWPPHLQISEVISLDELASVFPQFRNDEVAAE